MDSVRVLFLVASLAVAVSIAAADYPWSRTTNTPELPCDVCKGAMEQLLEARKKCCKEVSYGGQCFCPTMNTLIGAGVPLKDVCYDDMNCGQSEGLLVDQRKPCSVPVGACRDLLDFLQGAKKNPSCFDAKYSSSGDRCIVKILSEAGIKNAAKLIERL